MWRNVWWGEGISLCRQPLSAHCWQSPWLLCRTARQGDCVPRCSPVLQHVCGPTQLSWSAGTEEYGQKFPCEAICLRHHLRQRAAVTWHSRRQSLLPEHSDTHSQTAPRVFPFLGLTCKSTTCCAAFQWVGGSAICPFASASS